ncbi:MAG TPA: hypothetical protein VFM33_07065 [Aquabacterium sp.]|nr:hypothetical protein [Aquabacterium sp.]
MRSILAVCLKGVGGLLVALAVGSLGACGGGGGGSTASNGGGSGGTVTTSSINLPTSVEVVTAK